MATGSHLINGTRYLSLALPREEIGRAAVEALLPTFKTPDWQGREDKIAHKLIVRESTGSVTAAPARK